MTTLLRAQGLRHSYGGLQVLSGLDLHLSAGEVLGLLGPNGAGKSTTFAILAGQLRPDAGTVHLEER